MFVRYYCTSEETAANGDRADPNTGPFSGQRNNPRAQVTLKSMTRNQAERSGKRHIHPLTRVHPETGSRSLFISPDYCMQLEDMTIEESLPIIDMLEAHATRHEFICRFRWELGSIAV